MTAILKSSPIKSIPGDTLRRLNRAATDDTGRAWPVGTEYRPVAAGYDNASGGAYQTVRIGVSTVTFRVDNA